MGQEQEFERIRTIIRRRMGWFLWSFILLVGLVVAIAIELPNIYRSSATVLIQNQQIPSALVPSTVTTFADQRIQAINQEVMSRSKILSLVKDYNLLPDKINRLTTDDIVHMIRKRISLKTIDAEINKLNQTQPELLTIAFKLSYEDEDPKKAQEVANAIVSFYLEKNLEERERVAHGTTEFLSAQLDQEQKRMDNLQNEMATFEKKHLEELPEYSEFNMRRMESMNQRERDVDLQIRSIEEQRSILQVDQAMLDPYSGGANSKVLTKSERLQEVELQHTHELSKYTSRYPGVESENKEIQLLKSQGYVGAGYTETISDLKAAENKLARLKSTYTEKYPEVQSLEREIKEITARLGELNRGGGVSRSDILQKPTNPAYITLQAELQKATISIASLLAEKKQLESETRGLLKKLHAMPEVAKRYMEMRTQYQSDRHNYDIIEQKLLAARVSEGMEEDRKGESFQVIEPAYLPQKPAEPNRVAIILIGAVLAFALAACVVAGREFLDNRIHDLQVLQKASGFPVISIIPSILTEEEIAAIRKRRMNVRIAAVTLVVVGILVVHVFVMDLNIVYAKIGRLVQRTIP